MPIIPTRAVEETLCRKKWREDRDSTAKKRAGLGKLQCIRQWAHPSPLRTQAIGKAAVAADDGALGGWAKIVIAGQTFVAMKTTISRPANADALAHLKALGIFPECYHGSNRFMSGNERELRHAPLVVEHGKIGVANSAVRDFDFHLVRAQLAGIKFKRLQSFMGGCSRVSMNSGHRIDNFDVKIKS